MATSAEAAAAAAHSSCQQHGGVFSEPADTRRVGIRVHTKCSWFMRSRRRRWRRHDAILKVQQSYTYNSEVVAMCRSVCLYCCSHTYTNIRRGYNNNIINLTGKRVCTCIILLYLNVCEPSRDIVGYNIYNIIYVFISINIHC